MHGEEAHSWRLNSTQNEALCAGVLYRHSRRYACIASGLMYGKEAHFWPPEQHTKDNNARSAHCYIIDMQATHTEEANHLGLGQARGKKCIYRKGEASQLWRGHVLFYLILFL